MGCRGSFTSFYFTLPAIGNEIAKREHGIEKMNKMKVKSIVSHVTKTFLIDTLKITVVHRYSNTIREISF